MKEMETRDPKSTESSNTENGTESTDPKSDATSSETLSEVEQSEKAPETTESDSNEGNPSSVPSPDGAFDEGRGGQGGVNDAGPM
jgi:hypothetical protein